MLQLPFDQLAGRGACAWGTKRALGDQAQSDERLFKVPRQVPPEFAGDLAIVDQYACDAFFQLRASMAGLLPGGTDQAQWRIVQIDGFGIDANDGRFACNRRAGM